MSFFADKGFNCVAMSMRGYASSGKPKGVHNYALRILVNDVKELVEHLQKDQVVLVAHDWGGIVGWAFAQSHPSLVKRLVILNAPYPQIFFKLITTNISQFMSSWYIYFFQLPLIPEWVFSMGDFAFVELCFLTVLKQKLMSEEELETYKFYFSQPGAVTAMINYYRNAFKNRAATKEATVTSPTLVIWGEDDRALVSDNLKGLSQYVEDLQVMRLPGISHWVQQEDFNSVNRAIMDFVVA